MYIHPMWEAYPALAKALTRTQLLMEKSIQLKDKQVEKAILTMIHSGGKLLRPAYQLLFSQFGEKSNQKKNIALAAAIEMLHTATLIHDDIVDHAAVRRNQPTLHVSFDNQVAVYAGDYLFVCCFKLLSEYISSLRSIQLNAKSMETILNGEVGQMRERYNLHLSVAQYLENISGKTAELFALSCFVGAFESGTSEHFAKECSEIGKNIGIAFQIIDDVLDYTQQSQTVGKPVMHDIQQGIYSLPLLYALQTNAEPFIPLLAKKAQMTQAESAHVYQLVHQLNGVKQAQALAASYTQQALHAIEKLPDTEHQTKATLKQITQQILTRNS